MNVFINPDKTAWKSLLQRPTFDTSVLQEKVKTVLQDIQQKGDAAVKQYTQQFDGISLESFVVSANEMEAANSLVSDELKLAIQQAAANIRTFHNKQVSAVEVVETMQGINCWRKSVGIQKVGLYIPGGTAPLFSTILMLGIPAQIAGCEEVVLCSPPNKDGQLHPAILYAAQLVGIHKVFKIGGVQAIGAMAYGTETVPQVYKIFGPGNQYVTCAKQLIQQQGVAIDMPAGPSEVCVMADETANAAFVAADLLSQAEHGVDSQVLLVSTSELFVQEVNDALTKQVAVLSRKEMAVKALENSKAIVVNDLKT
ncbi:MAG: histidinol dehydrogenase, partial [Chitinophagaceae bacterium]